MFLLHIIILFLKHFFLCLHFSEKTFARQDAHRKTDQDCSEPDRERVIVKEQTKQRYAHLGNVQKDASAQAAVDEHFVESFRLAKLKVSMPPSLSNGSSCNSSSVVP